MNSKKAFEDIIIHIRNDVKNQIKRQDDVLDYYVESLKSQLISITDNQKTLMENQLDAKKSILKIFDMIKRESPKLDEYNDAIEKLRLEINEKDKKITFLETKLKEMDAKDVRIIQLENKMKEIDASIIMQLQMATNRIDFLEKSLVPTYITSPNKTLENSSNGKNLLDFINEEMIRSVKIKTAKIDVAPDGRRYVLLPFKPTIHKILNNLNKEHGTNYQYSLESVFKKIQSFHPEIKKKWRKCHSKQESFISIPEEFFIK